MLRRCAVVPDGRFPGHTPAGAHVSLHPGPGTRREAPDPRTIVIWLPGMAEPIKFLCSEIHTKTDQTKTKQKLQTAHLPTVRNCYHWRVTQRRWPWGQPARMEGPLAAQWKGADGRRVWPGLTRVEGQGEGPGSRCVLRGLT